MCKLEKPENLSFLAQILFELSKKNELGGGGQIDSLPGQTGLNIFPAFLGKLQDTLNFSLKVG